MLLTCKTLKSLRPKLRTLVVSKYTLYLMTADRVVSSHAIDKLSSLISSHASTEMLFQFRDGSPDVLLELVDVEQDEVEFLINIVNGRFVNLNDGQPVHLKLYSVPDQKLKIYSGSKNAAALKNGYSNEPDEKHRLLDQEIILSDAASKKD